MQIGIKGYKEDKVSEKNTAKTAKSGDLDVFATPFMIALMEAAASESLKAHIEETQSTVGTLINVGHVAATPLGMKVWAESELIEVQGKKLIFKVSAFDEKGLIGEGMHERFIIDIEKFMERTNSKLG